FNFETMFLDQYWATHNFDIDKKHFTLIFQANKLIYDIGPGKLVYTEQNSDFNEFTKITGIEKINTLNDYLAFTDFMIQRAKQNGAVGIKNSMAYGRSLDYENVSRDRAKELFNKSPEINKVEEKELQDFLLHYILDKAAENNLPVQIHTGYLAGNGNQLDNGKPTKLNNLFLLHPNTKFDIFHGGFPWTGEFVALGKMFPNVYLNLVWLPQISKQRAIVTFDEMLDCVPYNKFFWGGDCHLIEEAVGSLEFGKQVVCEVLAKRIENEQMNDETARKIIRAVFSENAIKLYQLDE
ncbi:MAG: amidohydrolase, partial [Draconibacterium sp.]|nr:amidohydrolase [Draconibacterium sp.]